MNENNENVEVVRLFTTSLLAGEVGTCLDLLDNASVFSESPILSFGGDHVGAVGFLEMLRSVNRDFRVTLETSNIVDIGDQVAVTASGRITSRGTERCMPVNCVDIYKVRDGKIIRVDAYIEDAHAFAELCRDIA